MTTSSDSTALKLIKDVLWALFIAGLVVGVGRFAYGLGASTNMTDALPWGWWKIFNMVAGAALATSGFIVAAIIYVLQLDRYRPVARLSVIVGFLGYGASLGALIFDIGLPHRGWHPFFMWNPHSFLFEVFWCVSLYWGVTALELIPIVTERFPRLTRFSHWMHAHMLPFVVLGITLSTMHHSSLGSLFMASPTRLHPLWHSTWIPPEFFISAMGAGLAALMLLLFFSTTLFRKPRDWKVLNGLAIASAVFLALYLVLKAVDFTVHDKWNFVFGPDITWETQLFWLEISLQAILPVLILSVPALRKSRIGLSLGAGFAVIGLVLHRVDTGIVGYFRTANETYFPNLSELVLSFGILAGAGLLFLFFVSRFHILDESPEASAAAARAAKATDHHDDHEVKMWTREETWAVMTGEGATRALRVLVIAVPLTWIAFGNQATGAFRPIAQPVNAAVVAVDHMRNDFRLDADRNGFHADFPHQFHKQELMKLHSITEEETCIKCHHLSLPNDHNTSCRRCHRDMELDTHIFSPANHADRFETEADRAWPQQRQSSSLRLSPGARAKLAAADLDDRLQTYSACSECHKDNMAGLADYEKKGLSLVAPGYKHAMHGSCLTCHRLRERTLEEDPAKPTGRSNCLFCHRQWADEGMFTEPVFGKTASADVVSPPALPTGEALWSITYHDGSNNTFRFTQKAPDAAAEFEYEPTQPAQSSSGIYSGGEAKRGTLDDAAVAALREEVERLASDPTQHAKSRMMGTGSFTLTAGDKERKFIVASGDALKRVNELLAPYRGAQ
jgi:Ni/Fe-hydrogenase subunit HybB-like protein